MNEKTKWYERSPNNSSSMRIALMICVLTGVLQIIFGIIFIFMMFITKVWEGIPIVTTMFASGSALMAVGDLAKGIQTKSEK
jgi:hypothetical protein